MLVRIIADQPEWVARHMPEIGERGSVLAALVARRAARVTRSRWEGLEVA